MEYSFKTKLPKPYIELSKNVIRFDAVSQLTNVFFDDSNKQIFAVRSGGATGVVVKGPTEDNVISFCMPDRGTIRSIKFSPDNQILAVQRQENSVEFICFQGDRPNLQEIIVHQVKALIYGFVWVHNRECALISNSGVEIFTVVVEKNQVKSLKAMSMNIKWFAWCSETNIALLCTADSPSSLIPVLIKQKSITKLPKLNLGSPNREVQESKVTLCQIYGVMAVLILQANSSGMMEVEVYLLNGPGLAANKCHVLSLKLKGLFAINTVDDLIVVHHQASATSLLFDISCSSSTTNDIKYHYPIAPGRSIKPFALKLPSLMPDGQVLQCELYSTNWVLFQPNIVIDAKLGCMWYLNLDIESLCDTIFDILRVTELLLQRSNGKQALLKVIRQVVDGSYIRPPYLPYVLPVSNKINQVYASWVQLELQNQTAQPSNVKTTPKSPVPAKVLIEQIDMQSQVFQSIADKPQCQAVLLRYLESLCKHNIAAQEDLSKLLIKKLIQSKSFDTLRRLAECSLLMESKAIACYLLSHSNEHPAVLQVALDMLTKIKAHEIIVEVLLGQGKVVDALRLAINTTDGSRISARKFLEAAQKTQNSMTFHSVFKYFQMNNLKQRGSMEFLKADQCAEFVQYYNNLYKTNYV